MEVSPIDAGSVRVADLDTATIGPLSLDDNSKLARDSDGDGLTDATEARYGSDPMAADTDGDGRSDFDEVKIGTDPTVIDDEVLTRGEEPDDYGAKIGGDDAYYGVSTSSPQPPDTDGDGLIDDYESQVGTDLFNRDTDGDGRSDLEEINSGSDPLVSADTDGDGLTDSQELEFGSDPLKWDTDGDGLSDGLEHLGGADPLVTD